MWSGTVALANTTSSTDDGFAEQNLGQLHINSTVPSPSSTGRCRAVDRAVPRSDLTGTLPGSGQTSPHGVTERQVPRKLWSLAGVSSVRPGRRSLFACTTLHQGYAYSRPVTGLACFKLFSKGVIEYCKGVILYAPPPRERRAGPCIHPLLSSEPARPKPSHCTPSAILKCRVNTESMRAPTSKTESLCHSLYRVIY